MRKLKVGYLILFLFVVSCCFLPYAPVTNAKYTEKRTKELTINAVQPTYTIIFNANGGTGSMEPQVFTYKTAQNLTLNAFTNGINSFAGWNTDPDGNGTEYVNGQSIYNLTSVNGATITLYAQWIDKTARIGNTYYDTLAQAVAVANASSSQVEIVLLRDTNENIEFAVGSNSILDLDGHTIHNVGNDNTIKNYGTLILRNGYVRNNATTNGAINNYGSGVITIDGVNVVVYDTGNRQAFYNEGGNATITGGSYLESRSKDRAAVTNKNNSGVMRVYDATIISTGHSGIKNENAAVLYIGDDSTPVTKATPYIRGLRYGIETTPNVHFYDGVLSGKLGAVDYPAKLISTPEGYSIVEGREIIGTDTYKTRFIALKATITFDANGGQINSADATRVVEIGSEITSFPTVNYSGMVLDGWFTDPDAGEGEQVTEQTIVNEDVTFYAHWSTHPGAARIGDEYYDTLQAAINAVKNNTPTTIELRHDTSEALTVSQNKQITINLNDNTISNSGDNPVLENDGKLTLVGGTITSDADFAAINQKAGTLNVDGVHILCTGTRQTLYITGGVTNITGDAYLSSETEGTPPNTSMPRAAVQVLSAGTLNVQSGTIIATKQHGISNEGILTIGTKDGTIDATQPVIIGKIYGVNTTGTFNFYDGIIKGETSVINGTITEQEDNSNLVNGTEGDYYTAYLELTTNPNNTNNTNSLNNANALQPTNGPLVNPNTQTDNTDDPDEPTEPDNQDNVGGE